jgi:hypothetical protein
MRTERELNYGFSTCSSCAKNGILDEQAQVFRAEADWMLALRSGVSCESPWPLAEENSESRPDLLAHSAYFTAFVTY